MRRPNILIDIPPDTVMVDGGEFSINADFRAGVELEYILQDKESSDKDKVLAIFNLYYGDNAPTNKSEAIDAVLDFYKMGKNPQKSIEKMNNQEENEDKKPHKRSYDLRYDDEYIYAAFLQYYGLDLCSCSLHWWQFMALFRSLPEESMIVKIMGYRAADTSKIKNRAERERIAKLKEVYALPCEMTDDEKVDLAGSAFGG